MKAIKVSGFVGFKTQPNPVYINNIVENKASPGKKLITIELRGGLGNQLFQLAFLNYVSSTFGKVVVTFLENLNQSSVHTTENYFNSIFLNWKTLSGNHVIDNVVVEKKLQPINLEELRPGTTKFIGYFQNFKYVMPSFTSKLYFSDKILDKYPNIDKSVFIHIRGGDYLAKENSIHKLSLKSYYEKAITYFGKETQFVIFTNDIEYAISHQFLNSINYSIICENEIDSLYLMSKCHGGICANSSFSWWGAYLNPKRKLVLPSKWYNDSNLYTEGYYFPGCITLLERYNAA